MKRVIKNLLLAVVMATEVGGIVGTYAVLCAPSAHAEPCGGRGYSQDNGGSPP